MQLTDEEIIALRYDWPFWARDDQLPPSNNWDTWLLLAGRGAGKTRSGTEWVRQYVRTHPNSHIALVGSTFADVEKTMLSYNRENVPGASGLLAVCPQWERPHYARSTGTLKWVNGCVATIYTAEKPDRLRGPMHHAAYVDELAAWGKDVEAWHQLQFGLRLGDHPQSVVTTTPRPIKILRDLIANPRTVVTRARLVDNAANLPQSYIDAILDAYGGTRLGRQEIDGELLTEIEGALWHTEYIDPYRCAAPDKFDRVVIAIDPAATSKASSDETGIIACGQLDNAYYVLADASGRYTPLQWASKAIELYHSLSADRVVAETNQGGEMIETTLRQVDASIPYRGVHARRGKLLRAEPIVALYEQGKVHHCIASGALEEQMLTYVTGDSSPDRLDALCYALGDLSGCASNTVWLDFARQATGRR